MYICKIPRIFEKLRNIVTQKRGHFVSLPPNAGGSYLRPLKMRTYVISVIHGQIVIVFFNKTWHTGDNHQYTECFVLTEAV